MGKRWGIGRVVVLVVLFVAIVTFFALNLGRFLTFDALNANKAQLQQTVANAPVVSVVVFGLAYVTVAALSLPVATAMTLLSGALFGRVLGTVIVDLAATTGATLAFLAVRYLLRDWVERRMTAVPDSAGETESAVVRRARRRASAWKAASEGIRVHGFSYLLVLRLLPIAPFFLVNLVSGVTSMPARTFILGTLVGILPGTFIYVNAGTAIGALSRPADLFSFQVVGALGLLALFSLIPVIWQRVKRRQGRTV